MKLLDATLVLAVVLFAAAWSDSAMARGGHGGGGHARGGHAGGVHPRVGIGVIVAAPVFAPWYSYAPYYSSPYYTYPPAYAAPYIPPVYIEQSPAPAAPEQQYWYYCPGSTTYYPYVEDCPGGWLQVAPQPPPPS